MKNHENVVSDLKECVLIKDLLKICIEKMKENKNVDYLDIVFEVVPYDGEGKPDINQYLKENKNFGVEIFVDAEYPEDDTVEMKVITNIQLLLQEQLE